MTEKNTRRNRWLLVSILVVLVLTLMPGDGKIAGNYLDKVAHFLMFFLLSLNCCYKFQDDKSLAPVLLWAVIFGLATEVLQQFIPGRNMDMYDGIADSLGIMGGYYLYMFFRVRLDRIFLKMGA